MWTKASGFTIQIPFSRFAFAVHANASASSIALKYKAGEHDVSSTVSSASGAGTDHANGHGGNTMPSAPADTGEALAKINTNMSLTLGAKYNISTFCNNIYAYGTQDGYNTAGSKVSLSDSADTITVPTSYNTSGGGYIDTSARWGTTDYTLTAYGYSGGVRAKLKGAKGEITTDCPLTLSIPSTPTNGAVTVEVKDSAKTVVKSGDAILVYKNGYLDGWNKAAELASKGYIGNTGAWCRLPNSASSYAGTGTTTRYEIQDTSSCSFTAASHTASWTYTEKLTVKKDWYLCNSSGSKEKTWDGEYYYYRGVSNNCTFTQASHSLSQSIGTWTTA